MTIDRRLMLKYHGSGDIDVALAYEFLLKGIGEHKLPEEHVLKSIYGYDTVVVRPSYYSLWDDKSYGCVDVGFYTEYHWLPKVEWDKHNKLYENGKGVGWTEQDVAYDQWFYEEFIPSQNRTMEDIMTEEGLEGLLSNWRFSSFGKHKFFEFKIVQSGWG